MTNRGIEGTRAENTYQRGISHAGIVIGLCIALALGVAIWWLHAKNNTAPHEPPSAIGQKAQRAIASAHCDYADTDLCKFFAGRRAITSYTVTTAHESGGQKSTTLLKRQSADTYYLKTDGIGATEVISIGTIRYTKTAAGTWQAQTVTEADAAAVTAVADPPLVEPARPGTAGVTYKKLGRVTCGSSPCFQYQAIDPRGPKTTAYIWFNSDDYHLQRMQLTTPEATTDAIYSLASVSIATPSPAITSPSPRPAILSQTSDTPTLPRTGDE